MSKLETLRPCDSCGVRVPAEKGHETSGGTFFCPACHAAPSTQRQDSPRRCTVCDQIVARSDCHKDATGKFVCLDCEKRRLRQTSRRQFFRFGRTLARFSIIGLIVILLAIVYIWLFVNVLDRASEPPPVEDLTTF
jgi:hypothetical protein